MTKRIAVIGSGISGLISAYLLSKRYDIFLFEANNYLGGHTHTVSVSNNDENHFIDTGFIVFNKITYPFFTELLQKHTISIKKSEMSFSYQSKFKNIQYCSRSINTLFSNRLNLFNPKFYRFIYDIMSFNTNAKKYLKLHTNTNLTIREFISCHNYSSYFSECYLIPMIASIWSKNPFDAFESSAEFILQFYANHGLLNITNQPQWYVLTNGSHSYIPALIQRFKNQIFLSTKINKIRRVNNEVFLQSEHGEQSFDGVVIASHSDEALKMLEKPTDEEQYILSNIRYTKNDIILHTDTNVLPKRQSAWASWNYFDTGDNIPAVTYYMNRLQSLSSSTHFCVSLNLADYIKEDNIIDRYTYSHPCYDQNSSKIQAQHALINGKNNTYYAGAYWGYGFHEDGVKSAIKACEPLGVTW